VERETENNREKEQENVCILNADTHARTNTHMHTFVFSLESNRWCVRPRPLRVFLFFRPPARTHNDSCTSSLALSFPRADTHADTNDIYVCIYIFIHRYTYICVYTYIYRYTYICVYTYIYVYVYIYTHADTIV